jgi:hypothetical protein
MKIVFLIFLTNLLFGASGAEEILHDGFISIKPSMVGNSDTISDSAILELYATNGALILPRLTEAQRDGLTPSAGMLIYNSEANEVEQYNGTAWIPVGFQNPMAVTGDIIYRAAGSSDAALTIGTEGQVLTVTSGLPSWEDTQSTYTDPLTTDGDILVYDTETKRLAVGNEGQVLTVDGTGLPSWENIIAGADDQLFPATNLITQNSGFELGALTGWVQGPGHEAYSSVSQVEVANGEYSLYTTFSDNGQYIETDVYTVPDGMVGKNGLFIFRYFGANNKYDVKIIDGSDNIIVSETLVATTSWRDVHINFILPTQFKVRIITNDDVAPAAYFDDFGVYDANRVNLKDISGAEFMGSVRWVTATGCLWSNTGSTTLANFSATAACTTPTGDSIQGSAKAPATKIPAISFDYLPAGRYKIVATGYFQAEQPDATTVLARFRFSDGTLTTSPNSVGYRRPTGVTGTGFLTAANISGHFKYDQGKSDVTIQIQGAPDSDAGQALVEASTLDYTLEISVYRYPTESEIAFRPSHETMASGVSTLGDSLTITSEAWTKVTSVNVTAATKTHYGNAVITTTHGDFGFKVPVVNPGTYFFSVTNRFNAYRITSDTTCQFAISDDNGTTFHFTQELRQVSSNLHNTTTNISGLLHYDSVQYDKEFTIYTRREVGGGQCNVGHTNVKLEMTLIPISHNMTKPVIIEQTYRQYDLTVTGTNWTTTRAVGLPYRTIDGTWRLRVNIGGAYSSGVTSGSLAISGIVAKNVSEYRQPISGPSRGGTLGSQHAYFSPNENTITWNHSQTQTTVGFSGDVELESKPTWALGPNN